MGLRTKTCDKLRKELVAKIHGQPTDQDITTLEKELVSIAASIPSGLGGGNHGHAGIIVEPAKYLTMTGVAFTNHPNQGTALRLYLCNYCVRYVGTDAVCTQQKNGLPLCEKLKKKQKK